MELKQVTQWKSASSCPDFVTLKEGSLLAIERIDKTIDTITIYDPVGLPILRLRARYSEVRAEIPTMREFAGQPLELREVTGGVLPALYPIDVESEVVA